MSPRRSSTGGSGRKALMLASQIGRSIESTLVGECEDEVLQNLSVDKVEPAPGKRMLVTLIAHPPASELAKDEVLARLEAVRPLLVQRVMADVSRRSIPELSFWLIGEPPVEG